MDPLIPDPLSRQACSVKREIAGERVRFPNAQPFRQGHSQRKAIIWLAEYDNKCQNSAERKKMLS